MSHERVEVLDLSAGAEPVALSQQRQGRPLPRLLTLLVAASLAGGGVGALSLHADAGRRLEADRSLTVTVVGARVGLGGGHRSAGQADAAVILLLRVSVPVRILDAELDGAPPVSRPIPGMALTRDPSVTVQWRVLCAEVGTIPGPRLLDINLHAQSIDQQRRVRLATTDDDAVSRVFRLTAEQGCTS